MWRKALPITVLIVLAIFAVASLVTAQTVVQRDDRDDYYDDNYDDRDYDAEYIERDYDDEYDRGYDNRIRIDRYLDADVWTNHSDNEFYSGDNITINYRVNRDAYVAIYSIDSRGRVNLLYPTQPGDNSWRRGGVTYRLPGADDPFDLVVNGPEGIENIAIIASRERFPIPNWYNGSGLQARDRDRDEFLSYLHQKHFMRYEGQRFAYDREVIYVNEWEPDYFRPVYYPSYPSWAVVGNVYFDYPWGSSVYINGIYWGCTPLYVPAVLVGWHTVTIYDPWGWCWEDNIHISRYNTVVLNHTVIRTRQHVVSKFKEVREIGYRDPVQHGYPKYHEVVKKSTRMGAGTVVTPHGGKIAGRPDWDEKTFVAPSKKYVRGTGSVTKTSRGYETPAVGSSDFDRRSRETRKGVRSYDDNGRSSGPGYGESGERSTKSSGRSGEVRPRTSSRGSGSSSSSSGSNSDYYRQKSGTVEKRGEAQQPQHRVEQKKEKQERTTYQAPERKESPKSERQQSQPRGGEVKQKSSGNSGSSGNTGSSGKSSRGSSGQSSSKGKGRN